MSKRRMLVAANWKMNGSTADNQALLSGIMQGFPDVGDNAVAICPPFVYINDVKALIGASELQLGAQNVSHLQSGAFTGEVAPGMLKDVECDFVIVGHSERRSLYNETDELVAQKFVAILEQAMTPILCIGETLEERENDDTKDVIARQLDAVINMAGIERFNDAVIAYEPVWAIGTGKTATPAQAQEVHEFIRLRLARHDNTVANNIRILYGGSVKANNAEELFSMADIDGGLIGGASLIAEDFIAICNAMR